MKQSTGMPIQELGEILRKHKPREYIAMKGITDEMEKAEIIKAAVISALENEE